MWPTTFTRRRLATSANPEIQCVRPADPDDFRLGNFAAGTVCVAMSYSFAFGKLGQTQCGAKDKFSYITTGCNCMAPNLYMRPRSRRKKFDDATTPVSAHRSLTLTGQHPKGCRSGRRGDG